MSKPKLIPLLSTPYAEEGLRLRDNGDHKGALAALHNAVALSDQYHHFYHYQGSYQYTLLAECYTYLDELGEAIKTFKKAIFQDHTNSRAIIGQKCVENNEPLPLDLPGYSRMVEYDCDMKYFIFLPGARPKKIEKTLAQFPAGTASNHYDRGCVYISLEKPAKAREEFTQCLKRNPAHSKAAFALGRIAFEKKEFRNALVWIKKACEILSIEHDCYHWTASYHRFWRGQIYDAMGDVDFAISDYTKAVDLHKDNKEALLARAEAYLAKGNAAAAEADMKKANAK